MLHALASNGAASKREIWWCYGTRNGREHPFATEARNLLNALPQSHSLVVYSKPEAEDQPGRDYDARGHLNLPLLQQRNVPRTADFYLCGPAAFLEEVTTGLKTWGVDASCIHAEIFGAGPALTPGIASGSAKAPHELAGDRGTGPNVSFTRSGLTVPWNPRFGSLLEFAEACDVPVRWSCRVGVCHNCESGLIDGKVQYMPEPLDRQAEGNVLICCSTPVSELELDL
jgi:ferredoxin